MHCLPDFLPSSFFFCSLCTPTNSFLFDWHSKGKSECLCSSCTRTWWNLFGSRMPPSVYNHKSGQVPYCRRG